MINTLIENQTNILMNKTIQDLDKAVTLSYQYTFSNRKKSYRALLSSTFVRVGINIKDKLYCQTTRYVLVHKVQTWSYHQVCYFGTTRAMIVIKR